MKTYKFLFVYGGALSLIVSGLILILGPFAPEFKYQADQIIANLGISSNRANVIATNGNILYINKIGFNAEVGEAEKSEIDKPLLNGPIRIKSSSTPDKGGNTVIVAHRAYYLSGPTTFYNLPKVQKDDEIELTWNKKVYKYNVSEIFETTANDTSIEESTGKPTLTLYTCTPLIDFSKRFVVRAILIGQSQN